MYMKLRSQFNLRLIISQTGEQTDRKIQSQRGDPQPVDPFPYPYPRHFMLLLLLAETFFLQFKLFADVCIICIYPSSPSIYDGN